MTWRIQTQRNKIQVIEVSLVTGNFRNFLASRKFSSSQIHLFHIIPMWRRVWIPPRQPCEHWNASKSLGFNVWLTSLLLRKEILFWKRNKWQPDAIWKNLIREAMVQKGLIFPLRMIIFSEFNFVHRKQDCRYLLLRRFMSWSPVLRHHIVWVLLVHQSIP